MRIESLSVVFALSLAALPLVPGQGPVLSGSVWPNPVVEGQSAVLTLNSTHVVNLEGRRVVHTVRAGRPSGPVVFTGASTAPAQVVVRPGALSVAGIWSGVNDFGRPVPSGFYFIEVRWLRDFGTASQAVVSEFYPVEVRSAVGPADGPVLLSPRGSLLGLYRGTGTGVALIDSLAPGGAYAVGASFKTNVGQSIGGLWTALDADALFAQSFPRPSPNLMNGTLGMLNSVGTAVALVFVPNTPSLSGHQVSLQAAVVRPGEIALSNPLTLYIR